MDQQQFDTVRWGHRVSLNGNKYVAIEYGVKKYDPDSYDEAKAFLKCVPEEDFMRWRLLRAWNENGVLERKPQEERETLLAEKAGYETEVLVSDLESAEEIRIVNGEWDDVFIIPNFGHILVNGEERVVIYHDETHFELRRPESRYGNIYHIHEFGEMCEKHQVDVKPEPMYLAALIDKFGWDFDLYEYRDSIDDSDESIETIKECIQNREIEGILDYLTEIVKEKEGTAEDRAEAKRLIMMLKPYKQEREVAV